MVSILLHCVSEFIYACDLFRYAKPTYTYVSGPSRQETLGKIQSHNITTHCQRTWDNRKNVYLELPPNSAPPPLSLLSLSSLSSLLPTQPLNSYVVSRTDKRQGRGERHSLLLSTSGLTNPLGSLGLSLGQSSILVLDVFAIDVTTTSGGLIGVKELRKIILSAGDAGQKRQECKRTQYVPP